MIIDNYNPKMSLYYIGAQILKILKNESVNTITDIYRFLYRNERISYDLFILAIEWMFIINLIDVKDEVIYHVS